MRAERGVLDTNILISAVLTRGKPFQVVRWVLDNGVLIFSDPTFEELATHLKKLKFDRYVSQERRNEILADLEAVAEWTAINGVVQACRDSDDDRFLETAMVAQADCVVTEGGDLLALNPFEHIRIITAAGLLEAVSG